MIKREYENNETRSGNSYIFMKPFLIKKDFIKSNVEVDNEEINNYVEKFYGYEDYYYYSPDLYNVIKEFEDINKWSSFLPLHFWFKKVYLRKGGKEEKWDEITSLNITKSDLNELSQILKNDLILQQYDNHIVKYIQAYDPLYKENLDINIELTEKFISEANDALDNGYLVVYNFIEELW